MKVACADTEFGHSTFRIHDHGSEYDQCRLRLLDRSNLTYAGGRKSVSQPSQYANKIQPIVGRGSRTSPHSWSSCRWQTPSRTSHSRYICSLGSVVLGLAVVGRSESTSRKAFCRWPSVAASLTSTKDSISSTLIFASGRQEYDGSSKAVALALASEENLPYQT